MARTKADGKKATGENLIRIIEEENRVLLCRIKELEEQLEKYEMAQPEEIPVPDTGKVFDDSMPVLLSETETPEAQKLNRSKKDEVFSGLPDKCDFSSNSEVASKHSAASSHSEGKCLQEESPFNENTPEPVLEPYGTLWKNLENCQLGSEHSDTLENLNGYSQGNLLNKKCCHCNKIHLENESIKVTGEHAIQLEEKEEEIDKLKACLEFVQVDLRKKDHTIKDLEERLKKNTFTLDNKKAKCKEYEQIRVSLQESLLSEREKNEQMVEKVKLIDYEKARWQKMHKAEVQRLNIIIDKKEKQKYRYEVEYINEMKLNGNLKTHICKLESQKQDLHQQLKTAQEDSLKKTKELEYLNAYLKNKQEAAKLDSVFAEMNASTSRDICNKSMLSGALCRKNGLQFFSHDEADYLNQSSLEDRNKDYKDDRMGELLRRNSILPRRLKSSYPLEMNLSVSNDKFYLTQRMDSPISENPGETEQHNTPVNKKRKRELDNDFTIQVAQAPVGKVKQCLPVSSSLKKLLNYRSKGHVKAKPSFVS